VSLARYHLSGGHNIETCWNFFGSRARLLVLRGGTSGAIAGRPEASIHL